jgi:hypothetical protein
VVIDKQRIDHGTEWRAYDEVCERTGAPLTVIRHNRGLSTEIGRGTDAKGGAAANFLSANEAELAVDDYTFIYDLDEAPARQLAEQWPSLPDAVQVSLEEGSQLLRAARDRTDWTGRERQE